MRSLLKTEDGAALLIGLGVVAVSLLSLAGVDALGWVVKPAEWTDPAKMVAPVSKNYGAITGWGSLALTFAVLLVVLTAVATHAAIGGRRFALAFAAVFVLTIIPWLAGHHAAIAATPDKRPAFGLSWSLGLTGEAGYILALLAGLLVANLTPGVAATLRPAARAELFVKAAVVILGAHFGIQAAEQSGKATASVLARGLAAIIEAYLIYWAVVYFVARKFFGFAREWAVPLASGISICGVSAAFATAAAIRARPAVAAAVSSLVVVFAVVELLFLPFLAHTLLPNDPMVAAAWMGLAVKTDGAAIASGTITEALYKADGMGFKPGAMVFATTTVKVFIDVFIGVWCFVLARVWVSIDPRSGDRQAPGEVWARFPKFVLGYFLAFAVFLGLGLAWPSLLPQLKSAAGGANAFRGVFFALTFTAIGLSADFRRLWAEGLGRLVLVYVVCLFGFVIWVGLAISWLFFHGVMPAA